MKVFVRSIAFSIALTLVFALVANLLPQVEGEAPQEQQVDLDSLTMEQFIALGAELFEGKGTCTLCHKPAPMGRAPDIEGDDMVALAIERLADGGYAGSAGDAEAYIRESMVDPGAFVVAGWGKKGSNDSESPMPAVDRPPIELSAIEIDAVIAWLQWKDGNEVTVALPTAAPETPSTSTADAVAVAPAATPEEALGKYGCQACHALLGSTASLGPPLDDLGGRMAPAQIRESILEPNKVIAEGFSAGMMPRDFAEKMTVRELQMIVELLAEQGR